MLKGKPIETVDFATGVFPEELLDVRERSIAREAGEGTIRRGDGLPDFDSLLDPGMPASIVLRTAIDELRAEENDAAWERDKTVQHKGLVGLAFSGGGIRSATYNLGVMQGLKRMGLFKCVDYLSTVSGGGYIGSCISATLASVRNDEVAERSGEPVNEIFNHVQGKPEPKIFRHLRDNANYLAPDGLRDVLRIPALLVRGIVVNFMAILPYILLAALLTIWMYPTKGQLNKEFLFDFDKRVEPFFHSIIQFLIPGFLITKLLIVLLFLIFALYPFLHMYAQKRKLWERSNWKLRNWFGRCLGLSVAVIAVAAFIEFQPIAITLFAEIRDGNGLTLNGVTFSSGAIGTVLAVLAKQLLPRLSNYYARFAFYVVGLLGVGVIWLVYIYLCVLGIDWNTPTGYGAQWWAHKPNHFELYGGTALFLWLYTQLTMDVNFTGIHKFYRDRLSKAYIVGLKRPENETGGDLPLSEYSIVHTDEVKLSQLNTTHAPYHLINALLNLKQNDERYKTGRKGDFFLFSKHFIGGTLTGYCRTEEMEAVSRHVDLATAMAISGAAAAANMGKVTVKPLIFILAMLNVRLNYWLPNPARLWHKHPLLQNRMLRWLPSRVASRVGPLFLVAEMFGLNSEKSRYVNLSDGGHIENLGAYELIRRQCRLIFVGDGEADPNLKFEGLAELIRMVQIDMGIKIEIDGLDEIRRGEQHHAVGTIHYPNGRIGKLIYLKSSLLGDNNLIATLDKENYRTSPYRDDNLMFDENAYIAHYKTAHDAFPHESTGDQFFDEAQFECYRALGYDVVMDTLKAR